MAYYDAYDPHPHGPYSRATPPPPPTERWLACAVGLLLLLALASCYL